MARYESLPYTVIEQEAAFELRRYEAFTTSAVEEVDLSGRSGFGTLFNYISGKNSDAEKMAMTVPVINTMTDATMSMEFVVPNQYQKTGIPEPLDESIELKPYGEHLAAIVRFSGTTHPARIKRYRKQLEDWLKTRCLETKGPWRLARYNSPFSVPMFRRNELWIEVVEPAA